MTRLGFHSATIRKYALAALAIGLVSCLHGPRFVQAQNTVGGGATAGVAVDADGVLRRVLANDPTGELAQQRVQEAITKLDRNIAKPSKLRKVSLTRLEKVLKQCLTDGRGIDDAMQNLAGLTRVQYVFCYPQSGDVVIAGPAEAWAKAPNGRMLAIDSGRPVLQLEDLIVALRAFPAEDQKKKPIIYCSIDPTAEGLARMHDFLRQLGGRIGNPAQNPGEEQFVVNNLRERLGMQTITVGGISPKTHFAQVMVEADYRMKLIGIGLEQPPVRLASYVDRARPSQVASNALQRWYFVPNYQCVRVSEDSLAMELVGDGVKLVGEDEAVSKDGSRHTAARSNQASASFVKAFTKVYPQLAQRSPVYAQLRNCIDIAIAAAFKKASTRVYPQWPHRPPFSAHPRNATNTPTPAASTKHQTSSQPAGGHAKPSNSKKDSAVKPPTPPQQVESAVNSLWKGNTL